MPTFEIPLLNIPRQRLTTAVNGQEVQASVWYQPSDGHWYITLESPVGNHLARGRRIVLDGPILGALRAEFVGEFYCRSIGEIPSEPGSAPWGQTHMLLYESE